MTSVQSALVSTVVMGAVIFFCRLFPFLFFRGTNKGPRWMVKLLAFVEKAAPPVAMTVLTFNALSTPIKDNWHTSLPVLLAALATALIHLWKKNYLISIFAGVLIFMVLSRVIP